MLNNYFFVDGSALLSQVKSLQKTKRRFFGGKLDILKFVRHFMFFSSKDLHGGEYKRAAFYFPEGERDIKDFLVIPDFKKPGLVRDVHFKYCGKKIKSSLEYQKFLETVPKKFRYRCMKSEKGIDIEICCDALKLAANGKLERLFFLTNDSDFLPLFKTLKDFGVNISLVHLSNATRPNDDLLREADSYDVASEDALASLFVWK